VADAEVLRRVRMDRSMTDVGHVGVVDIIGSAGSAGFRARPWHLGGPSPTGAPSSPQLHP
jgi:hypothetical protein